jgi:hypothetical protein
MPPAVPSSFGCQDGGMVEQGALACMVRMGVDGLPDWFCLLLGRFCWRRGVAVVPYACRRDLAAGDGGRARTVRGPRASALLGHFRCHPRHCQARRRLQGVLPRLLGLPRHVRAFLCHLVCFLREQQAAAARGTPVALPVDALEIEAAWYVLLLRSGVRTQLPSSLGWRRATVQRGSPRQWLEACGAPWST